MAHCNYSYPLPIPEGGFFSLEEIVNRVIAGYVVDKNSGVRISLESIKYAFIDCGNDGKKELAVRISTPTNTEEWIEYIIIREKNGSLETIFSDVAWSRKHIYLNEYGYFYNDGSNGAANNSFNKSFIDAKGNCHFLYSVNTTGFYTGEEYVPDLWFDNDIHSIPKEISLDGGYVFLSFDFNNTPDDDTDNVYSYARLGNEEAYESDGGYKGYYYESLLDDDSIYSEDHPLTQFFNNEGLKTLTITEINQMVKDKEIKEGLSDEIINSNPANWINLEWNFDPFISSYNDENILGINEFFPVRFNLCNESTTGRTTTMLLESNGEFSANYHYIDYKNAPDLISYSNKCIGAMEVEDKVNDHIYKLKVTYFALVNTPGTSETREGLLGSKTIKYYVDLPGFDDEGTEYIIYTKGTNISELDAKIKAQLSEEYLEENFEDGILQTYILIKTDGNNYVWAAYNY